MSESVIPRRREPADKQIRTRRASLRTTSYDPEKGTLSAVAATSHPVKRRSFDGIAYEVLSINEKSIRLSRFLSGRAPLLDNHRAGSLADQIGVITGARIENGQLIVDATISSRADDRMKQIRADLAGGIIRNVSIGYVVHDSEEARPDQEGTRTFIITDWEPVELSLVAVPADPRAFIRNVKGNTMENDQIEIEQDAPADRNEGGEAEAVTRTMSDREVRQALDVAAGTGLSAEQANRHINSGISLQEFRTIAFDHAAAEANRTRTTAVQPANRETFDNPDFLARSIEGALYARMAGKAPEGASAELMGRSLLDLGVMVLQARGERISWANRERLASQVLSRDMGNVHTTTDFPQLLTGAGNRVLMDSYKAAECPLKSLAFRRDATDFRALPMVKLSEAPQLLKVGETGEVKYGTRSEAKEGFKVETYARIFGMSRQSIINDDLGAFADSNRAWGRSAAEVEANLLVGLFTANAGDGANLDDGSPLYTTGRKNKAAAGGAINVTTIGAARQAMRETKGLDGITPIGVTPKHLVVGPAKETEAELLLASIAAAQISNANPFSGKLTLHVEPRFTGNAWRIFADASEVTTIVIAYLNGHNGPILESRQGWNTLGAEFRAILDFGCGLADWRGTYLNPGA